MSKQNEDEDEVYEGGFASSPLRRRLMVEKNVASQKIDFGLQQVRFFLENPCSIRSPHEKNRLFES